MLNTYRVISLSLVTALFFAAPLLCVHPISSQIKRAEHRQEKRVRVVSKRATHYPQINTRNASAAWARSIHPTGHKPLVGEDSLSTWSREDSPYKDSRTAWDAVGKEAARDILEAVSHSDL